MPLCRKWHWADNALGPAYLYNLARTCDHGDKCPICVAIKRGPRIARVPDT